MTYEELILDERAAMAKGKGGYPGPSTNAKFSLKKDSSLPWRASSLPPAFATSSPKIFGQDNARALNPNDYGRRLGGGLEASIPYRQNDDPDDLMKRKAKIGENSRMQNMPDASFIMWDYPDLEIFFRSAEHAAEWGSMSLPQRKQFLRSLFLKDMRRFWETNDLKEAIQHLEKGLLEAPADKIAPSLATIERYLRFMNQDSDGVEKRIPEFFRHDHRPLRNAMSAVNSGFTARFPETMKFLETNAVQVDDILGPLARINFILEHKLNYRLGWTRAEAGNSMYQPFPKFEHARITAAMAKSEETAISFKLKRLPPPPPDRPKPPELNAPEVKFFSESEFEQILDSYKKRAAVKDPPAKIEMSPILFLKLVSARERRGGYQMRTSEKLRIYDRWDNRVTQLCLGANAGEKGSKAHALKQLCATAIEDFVTASEGGVRMAPHAGKHGFDLLHPLEYFDPKREYLEVRLQSVRGIPWTGDNAAVVPKEFLPLLEAYEIKVTDAKPAVKPLPKPRRN